MGQGRPIEGTFGGIPARQARSHYQVAWSGNALCEAHDVGLKQVNLRKGRKEERRVSPDGPLRGGVNNNSGERDPRE